MLSVTLRGLLSRKLRTVLTAIAIVLGVAMITGTYILTDTIDKAFGTIFDQSVKGTDLQLTANRDFATNQGVTGTIDAPVLDTVRGVPGVALAEGSIFDTGGVSILDPKGKAVKTNGSPSFAGSVVAPQFNPLTVAEGREPTAPDEVAIDKGTIDKERFRIGGPVQISGQQGTRTFTLVGSVTFGDVASLGSATTAEFTLPTAQEMTNKRGRYDAILVGAAPGTDREQLKAAVTAAVPPTVKVQTGQEYADQQASDITDAIGFLNTALVAFGAIALFVGAFIIFNTLSITIAQRTREFGVLRAVGGSRRQVLGSVVVEALVVGVIASLIGLAAGFGVAIGLQALFDAFGLSLPTTGTVFAARTAIVGPAAGILVTIFAGLFPAIRASRVTPVVALRDDPPAEGRRGRVATAIGVAVTVVGAAAIAGGLVAGGSATTSLRLLGLGAVLVFIGVALLAPIIVRPLAGAIGWPAERLTKATGRIARGNTTRNPQRTATTAAALMIGLALVMFVAVFAGSIRSALSSTIDTSLAAQIVATNQDGFTPFSANVAAALRATPGVTGATSVRQDQVRLNGRTDEVGANGVDPATIASVYRFDWVDGTDETARTLGPTDALVEQSTADDNGLRVGSTFAATTPAGTRFTATVRGIYREKSLLGGSLLGGIVLPLGVLADQFKIDRDTLVLATTGPGTDVPALAKTLDDRFGTEFPAVEVLSATAWKDKQTSNINQVLTLFYVLLALSVAVSLFGIVNTLVLSVFERTREFGMLRAIGSSRRQMRSIVRYESITTSVIGAVLGIVVGLAFGAATIAALSDEGLSFVLPWAQIIVFVILAVVAGLIAAILPARRVSRLRILDAIADE